MTSRYAEEDALTPEDLAYDAAHSSLPSPPLPADKVNHPSHYTWMTKGIEVIDITSNFNFTIGNALKYLMRYNQKGQPIEDLKKALWYVNYEIERLEREADEV